MLRIIKRIALRFQLMHCRFMIRHFQCEITHFCAHDDAYDRHPALLDLVHAQDVWTRRALAVELQLSDGECEAMHQPSPLYWRK